MNAIRIVLALMLALTLLTAISPDTGYTISTYAATLLVTPFTLSIKLALLIRGGL